MALSRSVLNALIHSDESSPQSAPQHFTACQGIRAKIYSASDELFLLEYHAGAFKAHMEQRWSIRSGYLCVTGCGFVYLLVFQMSGKKFYVCDNKS